MPFEPSPAKRFGEGSGQAAEELRKAGVASIQGTRHVAGCLFQPHERRIEHGHHMLGRESGGWETCDMLEILS